MIEKKLTFIVPKNKKKLEIGAGCGDFGHKFVPDCLITEKNTIYKKICKKCYVEYFCDAEDTKLGWYEKNSSQTL